MATALAGIATAETAGPVPPPAPPSAECEWFGNATYTEQIATANTDSQWRQVDNTVMRMSSQPVDGQVCGATFTGSFTMDYLDVDAGAGCSTSYSQAIDIAGGGSGHYVAGVLPFDAETERFETWWYGDQTLTGTRTYAIESTCGVQNSNSEVPWTMEVGFQSGSCPTNASTEPYLMPAPDAQAVADTCTHTYQSTDGPYSVDRTLTIDWSMRRTLCDPAVDTDQGGVGDCDEFSASTNPGDPTDDGGPDPCPGDSDCDGVMDIADNCPSEANGDQANFDRDATGDVCDPDDDNDGLTDEYELSVGLNPRDPDTDDDEVIDGQDLCPTTPGTVASQGCPFEFTIDAQYAFTGAGGLVQGGVSADLTGTGLEHVTQVCFNLTWEGKASGRSSASLLWNGSAGGLLDESTAPADSVVDVNQAVSKNGSFEQEILMEYCTIPNATAGGLRAIYPWQLSVTSVGGQVKKLGIDDVVVTVRGEGGSLLGRVSLDDNSSKGRFLNVGWQEQQETTVTL